MPTSGSFCLRLCLGGIPLVSRANYHVKLLGAQDRLLSESFCRDRIFYSTNSKANQTFTSVHEAANSSTKLIRNVGLIAHIDAGKTTTTERILYFSHRTHHIGEVDRGNTVTDYLPEERERGITIVSATACLNWKQHSIHLIDTPGHVDFTMEVERCLAVLDGAVTILDGTKGVQAQTRTVWHQADRYNLPRIVFINKMDRDNANFEQALSTLSSQLASKVQYVPIHYPVTTEPLRTPKMNDSGAEVTTKQAPRKNRFSGLVDLITMNLLDWSACTSPIAAPRITNLFHLDQAANVARNTTLSPNFMKSVFEARGRLLGYLADIDEELADHFLSVDHPESLLPSELIRSALRRATHKGHAVPVLVGSSRQNIGIQPLLDAIVDYLPDPTNHIPPPRVQIFLQHLDVARSSSTSLQGAANSTQKTSILYPFDQPAVLIFKLCFDPHRGPLSLARVYSGCIKRGSLLTNWSRSRSTFITEKVLGVFQMTGEHQEPIECATTGNIVALTGLESTHSGDLLGPLPLSTKTKLPNPSDLQEDEEKYDFWNSLSVVTNCEPVVYAALEPGSLSDIRNMEHALLCMQREDPSFSAKLDEDTGQWIVGGMGDLHLEVVQSRLQREYKVDARLGPLLIAYKERPRLNQHGGSDAAVKGCGHATGSLDNLERAAMAVVSIVPSEHSKPQIHFDRSWLGHVEQTGKTEHGRLQRNVREGCLSTLEIAGPLLRSPVVNISVHVHRIIVTAPDRLPQSPDNIFDDTPIRLPKSPSGFASLVSLLRSAVTLAITDAVRQIDEWNIMEPMMAVELHIPVFPGGRNDSLSQFLGDLSNRRAEILSVDSTDAGSSLATCAAYHSIRATAPLSELVGYSTTVRSLSSGRAEVHMRLAEYRPVSQEYQSHLLHRFRWKAPDSR